MTLATPTRRMPGPEAARGVFGDLLGKAVGVDRRDAFDLDDPEASYVSAVFVEDDGSIGGACVADLPFAAFTGAALALIPKAVAEQSIQSGELDDGLAENFHEIANIATALLNGPSVPHLKIRDLVPGVPDEVRDLVIKAAGRQYFDATITDYGTGAVAFFAR